MTIERYKLIYAGQFEIELEIDDEKCTDTLLHEINNFWSGSERRLDNAGGDCWLAVMDMLCTTLMRLSITELDALEHMVAGKEEGWPPLDGKYGITLLSVDNFEFDPSEVWITRVAA